MQYTGLKDKNGKEIYEGDVVWYEDEHGLMDSGSYNIDFKLGQFCVDGFGLSELYVHEELNGWKVDIEVVGNIYEIKKMGEK